MRTVYVVTHPEATHHVDGLVGGWFDSTLTDQGRRNAATIARTLATTIPAGAPVSVHSSDLDRARSTAQLIATELSADLHTDPGLREKAYGEADGRPRAWLDARFAPPPADGDRMQHGEGIVGAETKAVFAARVYAAVDRALATPVEYVVLVTHGFALTFVVAAWCRLPIDGLGYLNLRATPGGITTLREDDFFHNRQVVRLDDVHHLIGRPE